MLHRIERQKRTKKNNDITSFHSRLVHFSILVLVHTYTLTQAHIISFSTFGVPKSKLWGDFIIVLKSDSYLLILQILFLLRIGERACTIQRSFFTLVFQTSKFGRVIYFTIYFKWYGSGNGNNKNTQHWFFVGASCGWAIIVGGYLFLRDLFSVFFYFSESFSCHCFQLIRSFFSFERKTDKHRYNALLLFRLQNSLHFIFRC